MKRFSNREKIIMALTIFIAAFVVLYNFVIEPVAVKLKKLDLEATAKKNALLKDMELIDRYPDFVRAYPRLASSRAKDSDKDETAATLKAIEDVSKANSCYIVSMKPLTPRGEGGYREELISVLVEGNTSAISKFMYGLESSEYFLRIKRFTIVPAATSSDRIKASLVISNISSR